MKKNHSFLFHNKKKRKYFLLIFQNKKIKYLVLILNILFLFYYDDMIVEGKFFKNKNETSFENKNETFFKIKNETSFENKNETFFKNNNLVKEDLTIVTALYKIKSKHPFDYYLKWVNNFLKINKPIIFFIDPKISDIVKGKRSAKFNNKTKWIELEMKDFYIYKNYLKYFKETNKIDVENNIHSVELYIVWAEKIVFLKKAININPFNSKCFYWVDAGYLREEYYSSEFLDNWPSTKRCLEDPRITFITVRQSVINEINNFATLHMTKGFFRTTNVAAGFFGGTPFYILKFYEKYFETIKKWYDHSIFIGKEQNVFASVIYLNPKYCKYVYPGKNGQWYYPMEYFS